MRRRRGLVALAALALVASGCAGAPRGGPDILYVATPEQVGVEMLRLAAVTARDVVYDLGSGDGRVVVAAARDFGARGVGVEIDPGLVQDSRERALQAAVADRVDVLWQDLFAVDIGAATVVTLYLGPDVNLRLRPKLLRELRPGTRVVSHDFHMADWAADRVVRVRGPDREHTVYFWVVPADVAGTWRVRLGPAAAPREGVLVLDQRFQRLGGSLTLEGRRWSLTGGQVAGGDVSFTAGALAFRGSVGAAGLQGHVVEPGAGGPTEWSARRGG